MSYFFFLFVSSILYAAYYFDFNKKKDRRIETKKEISRAEVMMSAEQLCDNL